MALCNSIVLTVRHFFKIVSFCNLKAVTATLLEVLLHYKAKQIDQLLKKLL